MGKNRMRLVICGNGFDLHHHLKTGYWDYREFLRSIDKKAVERYEFLTRLSGTPAWNDVEASLEINYSEYIDKLIKHYGEDSYPEIYVEDELRFLFNFTGEYFARWFEQIDYSVAKPDLCLSQNDMYVTFNYTDTLQQVYGIPEDKILYIHGKLDDIDVCAFGVRDVYPSWATVEDAEVVEPIAYGDQLSNDLIHDVIKFGADAKKVAEKYAPAREKYHQKGNSHFKLIERMDEIVSATTKDVYSNFDKLKGFFLWTIYR